VQPSPPSEGRRGRNIGGVCVKRNRRFVGRRRATTISGRAAAAAAAVGGRRPILGRGRVWRPGTTRRAPRQVPSRALRANFAITGRITAH